jgi:6,7-dimethyl-8-ribityllumazine synthase
LSKPTSRAFEGKLDGAGLTIAIAVSRFNSAITQKLLDSAQNCLLRHGVPEKDIHIAWVSGAFELSQAVHALAQTKQYDGIIPLGCVIRGETPHFDYICQSVTSGITKLSLESNTPIVFGILTTDTLEQAWARAGVKSDKGIEAVEALLDLIQVIRAIRSS